MYFVSRLFSIGLRALKTASVGRRNVNSVIMTVQFMSFFYLSLSKLNMSYLRKPKQKRSTKSLLCAFVEIELRSGNHHGSNQLLTSLPLSQKGIAPQAQSGHTWTI